MKNVQKNIFWLLLFRRFGSIFDNTKHKKRFLCLSIIEI